MDIGSLIFHSLPEYQCGNNDFYGSTLCAIIS